MSVSVWTRVVACTRARLGLPDAIQGFPVGRVQAREALRRPRIVGTVVRVRLAGAVAEGAPHVIAARRLWQAQDRERIADERG